MEYTAAVSGTVIYNKEFEISESLRQDTVNALIKNREALRIDIATVTVGEADIMEIT